MPLTDAEQNWIARVSQVLSVSESEPEEQANNYIDVRDVSNSSMELAQNASQEEEDIISNPQEFATQNDFAEEDIIYSNQQALVTQSASQEEDAIYNNQQEFVPQNASVAEEIIYSNQQALVTQNASAHKGILHNTLLKSEGNEQAQASRSEQRDVLQETDTNTVSKKPASVNTKADPTSGLQSVKANGVTTRVMGPDYKDEDKHAAWRHKDGWRTQNEEKTATWSTKYYEEAERKQSEVDEDTEGVLHKASGEVYKGEAAEYVLSPEGQLHTFHQKTYVVDTDSKGNKTRKPKNAQVAMHEDLLRDGKNLESDHHSSVLAGGEVAGAGDLKTDVNGRIKAISNKSGHYKPTIAHLLQTVEHLLKTGALLDKTPVDQQGNSLKESNPKAFQLVRVVQQREETILRLQKELRPYLFEVQEWQNKAKQWQAECDAISKTDVAHQDASRLLKLQEQIDKWEKDMIPWEEGLKALQAEIKKEESSMTRAHKVLAKLGVGAANKIREDVDVKLFTEEDAQTGGTFILGQTEEHKLKDFLQHPTPDKKPKEAKQQILNQINTTSPQNMETVKQLTLLKNECKTKLKTIEQDVKQGKLTKEEAAVQKQDMIKQIRALQDELRLITIKNNKQEDEDEASDQAEALERILEEKRQKKLQSIQKDLDAGKISPEQADSKRRELRASNEEPDQQDYQEAYIQIVDGIYERYKLDIKNQLASELSKVKEDTQAQQNLNTWAQDKFKRIEAAYKNICQAISQGQFERVPMFESTLSVIVAGQATISTAPEEEEDAKFAPVASLNSKENSHSSSQEEDLDDEVPLKRKKSSQ